MPKTIPAKEYAFEDMVVEFGQTFIGNYILGKGVEAVAKYGLPALKKGLLKMGIDETTVNKWLKDLDDGNGGKGGGSCSFSAETLVLTDEGFVPISWLDVWDMVWAYNEETGEFDWYPVTAVWAGRTSVGGLPDLGWRNHRNHL